MSDNAKLTRSKLPISGRIVMFFIRHVQQAMASMGELWRSPVSSLMTMAVLGVSLSLPAALQVLVKNAETITSSWNSAAEISLFIDENRSEQTIQSLLTRIRAYAEVEKVQYIDRNQALEEFQRLSGFGEALAYLDKNPLPAVITVTPTQRYSTPVGARELLTKLEREPEISFGRLDIEWLERLQAVVRLLERTVMAIAALLVLAVVLVIGNTIRLAIMNRRTEIEVMKLVGAFLKYRRDILWSKNGNCGSRVNSTPPYVMRENCCPVIAATICLFPINLKLASLILRSLALNKGWLKSPRNAS